MTRADVRAQLSRLEAAFTAGNVDLLAPLVTERVIWSTALQSPWLGRQEVLDRLAGFFGRHSCVLRFSASRVDASDTRAVVRTNFESWVDRTPGPGGEPHRGSAVIVWTLEDRWMIAAYLDVGGELF